jgi:hypothetical protein
VIGAERILEAGIKELSLQVDFCRIVGCKPWSKDRYGKDEPQDCKAKDHQFAF